MSKILSIEQNKNYKILTIESIKKFLNIVSQKDDSFLEELYLAATEYSENLLGICMGEKKYTIEYQIIMKNLEIKLKYGPIQKIDSCKIINSNGGESQLKDFEFSKETQKFFLKSHIFDKNSSIIISQQSKIDESYKNFESIKIKLLKHINILYKNRNSYICEKNNIDSHLKSIYQDLIFLLK
jgi:hypothetical protein